tara:strand:- start:817 stop:1869 length:1053 start_codon:yes stop_codon:yes gene_type:complete
MFTREWRYKTVGNDDFTVMQFNVLADGLAQTGGFTKCSSSSLEWEARMPLIEQEIRKVNPDVLCLQEVNMPQDFARFLPGHAMLFCPKLDSPAQAAGALPDGCAMFIRRDKFHILDAQVFYYNSLDPDKAKSAGGIVVGVKDKRNKQGLVFATTHLKAKEKPEFELIRNDQLTQLLQKVEGMSQMTCGYTNASQVPIILTGDFNSPPTESCYKLMRARQFESVYSTQCNTKRAMGSHAVDEEAYAAGEPEFTTMKVRESLVKRTIDYIWVGSGAATGLAFQGMNAGIVTGTEDAAEIDEPTASRDLLVQALYSLPSAEDIGSAALPCARYPSDHCSIAAKIAWSSATTST